MQLSLLLTAELNKLERLSPASLYRLVYLSKVGTYTSGAHW